jgi:uncharacterized protein YacL
MVLHVLRAVFLVVVLGLTVSFAFQDSVYRQGPNYITWYILVPAILGTGLIMLDMFWKQKRLNILSGLFFGVLAGLLLAYVLSVVVDLGTHLYPGPAEATAPAELSDDATEELSNDATKEQRDLHEKQRALYEKEYSAYLEYTRYTGTTELIKLLLGAMAVFLCVTIVMQTKDEFRFIIPYVEFSKQAKGAQPILVDTSTIIDGRIADVAGTHVFQQELIVPRFVLAELQQVADSDDKLKRNRGRRGLDILQKLQKSESVDVNILEAHVPSVQVAGDVDAKLVALAKHLTAKIVTNDFNLNKVASLRGIDVINLNDLANALKPIVLPGELMNVKIIRPGEEASQGVGYLDDGTMVVVDGGKPFVGKTIELTVTSVLQTSAGRMIFGKQGRGESA